MDEQEQRAFVSDMLAKGHKKDDIFAALDRIDAEEGPKPGHGRGDELFQPDPSPSGPITRGPSFVQRTGDRLRDAVSSHVGEGEDQVSTAYPEIRHALAGTPQGGPADDRQEAQDFARFALGGLTGMGASSLASKLGAGGRTSGIIGGAVGGAVPKASEPGAKPMDIVGAALMGGAITGATTPRGTRNQSASTAGRATNAVERVGGRTGVLNPAKGGMFDEPAYKALPDGDPGTADMAGDALNRIVPHLEARDAANRGELGATEARVENELGGKKFPTDPIQARTRDLRAENSNNPGGTPNDPALEARLKRLEGQLGVEDVGPAPAATFGQLRGLQKSLAEEAQYGQPSTMENRPARLVHGSATDAVKGAHPDLPGAYEKYGAESKQLEDAKNILYSGDGAVRDESLLTPRNQKSARGVLATYGKEGQAASNTGKMLDELGAQSPLYRQQLDRLSARNAADVLALQLSMPGGAGIAQGVARTIGHNLGAAGERFVRPATGIGYHGAGPGAAQLQLDPIIQLLLEREHRR